MCICFCGDSLSFVSSIPTQSNDPQLEVLCVYNDFHLRRYICVIFCFFHMYFMMYNGKFNYKSNTMLYCNSTRSLRCSCGLCEIAPGICVCLTSLEDIYSILIFIVFHQHYFAWAIYYPIRCPNRTTVIFLNHLYILSICIFTVHSSIFR